jgi:hypothetical protein
MTGVQRIAAERRRQTEMEGYSPTHDDEHTQGELGFAAIAYAEMGLPWHEFLEEAAYEMWPWDEDQFKAGGVTIPDHVRNLTKAGALIAAEIDRLTRRADAREGL